MLAVWQTDEPGLLMKEGKQSGGETPSRTESSCPARRSRADNVLSDKDVTQPLTLTLSHKGRGDHLPRCNALRLLHPTCLPQGRGDGYRGRLRFANRPYGLIAPCALSRGGRGALPLLGAPSSGMLGCRTVLYPILISYGKPVRWQ